MKNLIIAEKSSVAADIAKALGNFKKASGFFKPDDMIIVGAVGHFLALQCPPSQDVGIPVIPTHFDLLTIETSPDRLALVESPIARRHVETLIHCCYAGREGELIFRGSPS